MNTKTRSFTAGIALLLIGLSFIEAVNLTAPRTARANPGVRYAAPTAQGSGDCSSWANACTLQTALAQAVSGDEIWVKMGVYYPGANRTDTFTLENGVALYGGFAGTETQRDQRDWQVNVTILSGDIDKNDINNDGNFIAETWTDIQGNNAYHVVTGSGTDASAVLDGFIITAGQANGSAPDNAGGGMYNSGGSPTLTNVTFSGNCAIGTESKGGGMYNESGSPTLTNITFRSNAADWHGGGMYNSGGAPTLTNVTFSGNSAGTYGGGMYNYGYYGPSSTLTNVTFSGNWARYGGGGMSASGYSYSLTLTNVTFSGNWATRGGGMRIFGNPTLTNVTFSNNSAGEGGGIYNSDNSSPTLTNVTFSGNSAEGIGGGMYNINSSSPTLTNVTFGGNSADWYGGGMYNHWSSNPTLTNVIIWGNNASSGRSIYNYDSTPTIAYSDIQYCGGSDWNSTCGTNGGGNIDADPRFVNPAGGNLRLQLTSPAIDAGKNAAVPAGIVTDLDGNWRFADIPTVPNTGNGTPPIVDMGAYEAQSDTTPPAVVSITRADPNPTHATSAHFRVAFSEAVRDVGVSDFSLTTTGLSGASVTSVAGGGATYTVTASTGAGSGTLRLDITATATISDMAGNPLGGLPYTGGEVYEVKAERVRYAAPTAQGSGDCGGWANACTLRTALAQAQSGNEIWVKAGAHYPGVAGARSATFTLKNGVALYGGFAGTETARDQRDWQVNKTILSGDIDKNDNHGGDYINENASQIVGANAYHVVTSSGTDATAVLDGFVITAGQANSANAPDNAGGGMHNVNASPTLANVTFSGNAAAVEGGGLYNESGNPTLTNVTFSKNWASYGSGIYTWQGAPTLTDVAFSGNVADWYGGGMQAYYSNPTLTNVTFISNTARFGGGMRSDAYNGTLTNVTFRGNSATVHDGQGGGGGGLYHRWGNPTLTNVTFSGNSAAVEGGGMVNNGDGGSSNPTLTNVTFSSNRATYGGGIYTWQGAPVLNNVTFSGNAAIWYGGGMQAYYSNPTLTNVTFINNTARYGGGMHSDTDSATLTNVTFSGNSALVSDGHGGSGGGLYHTFDVKFHALIV